MYYPLAVEPPASSSECFGVSVPDLPGCFSYGETFEEALENAKEAIALHLAGMAEDGEYIGLPKGVNTYFGHPNYQGMLWAVVEVSVDQFLTEAQKVNVTLPKNLLHRIECLSNNRSRFLADAAWEKILKSQEGSTKQELEGSC